MTNKEMIIELDRIDSLLEGEFIEESKTTKKETKKKTKSKSTVEPKSKTTEENVKQIDSTKITKLLDELPDVVTTRDLNKIFNFNDGGKYLRRHLRSKFGANHEPNTPWRWDKSDKQLVKIIEYFITVIPESGLQCIGDVIE